MNSGSWRQWCVVVVWLAAAAPLGAGQPWAARADGDRMPGVSPSWLAAGSATGQGDDARQLELVRRLAPDAVRPHGDARRDARRNARWDAGGAVAAPLRHVRMPAEFERCEAVLLAASELVSTYPDLFVQIVAATHQRAELVALVGDQQKQAALTELLVERGLPAGSVRCLETPHDSMWIRDYGPIFVTDHQRRSRIVVDGDYSQLGRPNDDQAPARVAALFQASLWRTELNLEGGNLLSNGEGLVLATTAILDMNSEQGRDEPTVRAMMAACFGASEVVFLEPLQGESTGHVDMFAAFTAPGTVVVGAFDPQVDSLNAEVLDRNAQVLAGVVTAHGPLNVVRIPMPPHDDGIWRTYTNGIFVNGALLVPVYAWNDEPGRREALAVFRQLLPGWRIVPVDASDIIQLGGALHCISMQVPAAAARRD